MCLVGAGLMAPLLSSFPDAWIVSSQRGEQFWTVWRNRFFSNTLTELVCVPAIVMLLALRMAGSEGQKPSTPAEEPAEAAAVPAAAQAPVVPLVIE